jgi:MFS family permease
MIGACLMLVGYVVIAMTSNGEIDLNVGTIIFFGFIIGQGSAWCQVATCFTNVSNTLPQHRGAVFGLLYAGNALSSGIFTQILQVFGLGIPAFLIVTGITMSITVILCYPSTHYIRGGNCHTDTLFIIPLAIIMLIIAMFVAIAAMIEDQGMHVFILVLFGGYIVFIVALSSVMYHIYGRPVLELFTIFEKKESDKFTLNTLQMSVYKNERDTATAAETSSLISGNQRSGTSVDGGGRVEGGEEQQEEEKEGPENPDGATFWMIVKTYRFWLIFFTLAVGSGAGLTVLYNIAKIVDAHSDNGSDDDVHSSLKTNSVALFSAFNTAGRIIFGFLSDVLLVRRGISRAWMLGVNCILMAIGTFFMAYVVLSTFNYVIILCSFSYGGFVSLVPALIADVFGTESYGTFFAVTNLAPILGAELLYNWLSTEVYNEYKNESDDDDSEVCFNNPACFKLTFLIISGLSVLAFLASSTVGSLTVSNKDRIFRSSSNSH